MTRDLNLLTSLIRKPVPHSLLHTKVLFSSKNSMNKETITQVF